MAIFKNKVEEDWKIRYIKEFNDMRSNYEDKLDKKQKEVDKLRQELEDIKSNKNTLRPKEKQIRDIDIENIKKLRNEGLSYREIAIKTSWSKATICRVLNGLYD